MKLYLDEDSAKGLLATHLRKAGHQVTVPAAAGLSGASDPTQFLHAVVHADVLLTRNHDDFQMLQRLVQATSGRHPGLLVVRRDNDRTRDMKDGDIVRAIRHLEQSGTSIPNECHILNHWR